MFASPSGQLRLLSLLPCRMSFTFGVGNTFKSLFFEGFVCFGVRFPNGASPFFMFEACTTLRSALPQLSSALCSTLCSAFARAGTCNIRAASTPSHESKEAGEASGGRGGQSIHFRIRLGRLVVPVEGRGGRSGWGGVAA